MKPVKIILIATLIYSISLGYAQKLPGVQKKRVFAPTNVKIDGKATEWGDSFQAYNHATNIFYTIANDNENLYLAIKATNYDVIDKILRGGITFKIKTKSKQAQVTFTYGAISIANGSSIGDLLRNKKDMDEAYLTALNRSASNSKSIIITGVEAFPDSVLSAYNEEGIHAASALNIAKAYVWEMSINLKYLPKEVLENENFIYSVILNGWESYLPANFKNPNGILAKAAAKAATDPVLLALNSPTDFSGNYTLAKK